MAEGGGDNLIAQRLQQRETSRSWRRRIQPPTSCVSLSLSLELSFFLLSSQKPRSRASPQALFCHPARTFIGGKGREQRKAKFRGDALSHPRLTRVCTFVIRERYILVCLSLGVDVHVLLAFWDFIGKFATPSCAILSASFARTSE